LAQRTRQAGRQIKRIVVAYEAGRDGFWLARWLRVRDVEAYVIHPASIAVSREHRRAKTDRLDTELLLRAFLGWLRGEKYHCSMVAIPTVEDEDARRPNRERGNLVTEQTRIVNQIKAILARFGIRTFRPTLRKAEEKLGDLRTAETKFFHLTSVARSIPELSKSGSCSHDLPTRGNGQPIILWLMGHAGCAEVRFARRLFGKGRAAVPSVPSIGK
jgi:transposase